MGLIALLGVALGGFAGGTVGGWNLAESLGWNRYISYPFALLCGVSANVAIVRVGALIFHRKRESD